MYKPHKNESKNHLNSYQPNLDNQKRFEFQDMLEKRLQATGNGAMNWNDIKINMLETTEEVVGYRKGNKNKRPENKEVETFSEKQKELRLKIAGCNDSEKSQRMKAERNKILHQIKQKPLSEKERQLDEKVKEIDKEKDTTKMFKSVRERSRNCMRTHMFMVRMEKM